MKGINQSVIRSFLSYIKNVRQYSSRTIRSYSHDLDDYYSYCINNYGEKEFINLDHKAIQSYLQYLSKRGLSAKTLARRLASIKSLYKYMLINNMIRTNSAKFVKITDSYLFLGLDTLMNIHRNLNMDLQFYPLH